MSHSILRSVRVGLLAALAVGLPGCRALLDAESVSGETLLRAARSSPDAVVLDLYWATLPPAGEDAEADLWRYVQEDRLDEGLRRRLAEHGLRAGVVGGAPPMEIVRLLDPERRHVGDTASGDDGGVSALDEPTGVVRKTTQLRPGKPLEVKASGVIGEAPLLAPDGRSAEMIRDAQAFYTVRVERRASGAYAVTLTPELQSGEARWRWTQDETGMIARQEPLRDKRVFDELRIEAPLVVGEMLVVTARPGAPETLLGRYLHRGEAGGEGGADRAILVRLVNTPGEWVAERGDGASPAATD